VAFNTGMYYTHNKFCLIASCTQAGIAIALCSVMIESSWHLLHASNKYAKLAQGLAVELCWRCWLISAEALVHL
jgi:hypothetical protein